MNAKKYWAAKNAEAAKTTFVFKLSALQAQEIFSLVECWMEDDCYRGIWSTKKKRALARQALNRFARQLNRQYLKTGVEVWPDE